MNHATKAPDDVIRVRRLAPGYPAPLHPSGERGLASRAHTANVFAAIALIVGFAVPAHAAPDCYGSAIIRDGQTIRDLGGECEVEVGPRTSTVAAGGTVTITSRWCEYLCPAICEDRSCSGRTSDVASDVICEPGAACVGAKNANGMCTGQDAPAGTYCKNGDVGDLGRAVIRAYPLPGSTTWANDLCPRTTKACVTQTRTLHWYTPETGEVASEPGDEQPGAPEPVAVVPVEQEDEADDPIGSVYRYDNASPTNGHAGGWSLGYRDSGVTAHYFKLSTGIRQKESLLASFVMVDADGEVMPCPNNALGHEITLRWQYEWSRFGHVIESELEATVDEVRLSHDGMRCIYEFSGQALSNVTGGDFGAVDVEFGVILEETEVDAQ